MQRILDALLDDPEARSAHSTRDCRGHHSSTHVRCKNFVDRSIPDEDQALEVPFRYEDHRNRRECASCPDEPLEIGIPIQTRHEDHAACTAPQVPFKIVPARRQSQRGTRNLEGYTVRLGRGPVDGDPCASSSDRCARRRGHRRSRRSGTAEAWRSQAWAAYGHPAPDSSSVALGDSAQNQRKATRRVRASRSGRTEPSCEGAVRPLIGGRMLRPLDRGGTMRDRSLVRYSPSVRSLSGFVRKWSGQLPSCAAAGPQWRGPARSR